MDFAFSPIAFIESPYKEKFAIPRQPGLVPAATGKIVFTSEANNPETVRGIEQYSHLWIIFVFHGTQAHGWKPLVRPPRLGGNEKTGVFSTRSTFRPNAIGMSVVSMGGGRRVAPDEIDYAVGLDNFNRLKQKVMTEV